MKIYSGDCCMCDVGIPTKEKDMHGNELYSGDIVQLWHGNFLDTEIEEWLPSSGITAIVGKQYQSFTDGTVELIADTPKLFTMGISTCGVQNHEWKVALIKSHEDIIMGERFASFGFNFRD